MANDHLNQLPTMHPREPVVRAFELDLRTVINEVTRKHGDITEAEFLRVMIAVFGSILGDITKHMIRRERHPENPDKPGGWA